MSSANDKNARHYASNGRFETAVHFICLFLSFINETKIGTEGFSLIFIFSVAISSDTPNPRSF